jgi:hypothetical protein
MKFTACQESRFFKRKYWKLYNAVYCLLAITAVSLNGITEYSTMQFASSQHSRFFKRKYWKQYKAVYCLSAEQFV